MTPVVPPQRGEPDRPDPPPPLPGSSRHYRSGSWSVVEIVGEVDLAVAPALRETLRAVSSPQVVFDLRGVTFLGSTGLTAIIDTWREAESRGGEVRLLGPTGPVQKVLQITGVDRLLASCDSLEELDQADA